MQHVFIGGIRQPLAAEAWNPRYRSGIRHCAAVLAKRDLGGDILSYRFQGEEFHVESDMWKIAEAVLALSIPDRVAHGWADVGWPEADFS